MKILPTTGMNKIKLLNFCLKFHEFGNGREVSDEYAYLVEFKDVVAELSSEVAPLNGLKRTAHL